MITPIHCRSFIGFASHSYVLIRKATGPCGFENNLPRFAFLTLYHGTIILNLAGKSSAANELNLNTSTLQIQKNRIDIPWILFITSYSNYIYRVQSLVSPSIITKLIFSRHSKRTKPENDLLPRSSFVSISLSL